VYLEVLAEAVNAVADWPLYCAMCYDVPARLLVGFKVGPQTWHIPLKVLKVERDPILAKRDQLLAIAKRTPTPLRPYPYDQRAREVYVRAALLSAAVNISDTIRRETAKWITFLGRLRSAPNGALMSSAVLGVAHPWNWAE
jgi:hypothetical protein